MASQTTSDDLASTIAEFRQVIAMLTLTITRAKGQPINPHTLTHLKTIASQMQQLRHELEWHNEKAINPATATE